MHLCIQTTKGVKYSNVKNFNIFISAAAIRALSPNSLGDGSSYLDFPYSGGVDLGITVFTSHLVVNYVSSVVLEGASCETSVMFTFHQQ